VILQVDDGFMVRIVVLRNITKGLDLTRFFGVMDGECSIHEGDKKCFLKKEDHFGDQGADGRFESRR
jgi:hypothetical protein